MMSTVQSVLEDAVIDILSQTGPCTIDEVVKSLPAHDWSEVFSAIDDMSRDGRLVLRRPARSGYQLSLSTSRQVNRTERINPIHVRFCVGCGYLCDDREPEGGSSPWVEANRYLKKYGLTWVELDRVDTMCQACAHVQACGMRRASPKAASPVVR